MNGRSPVLARSGEVIEQERRLPPLARLRSCGAAHVGPLSRVKRTRFAHSEFFAC
jgi:hypothetical protein